MKSHRASYLKTALAALMAFVAAFSVAGYEIAKGSILLSLTGWTLFESHVMRWASTSAFVVLGLVCLLVATGGFIALHGDAKENGTRPER